MKQQEENLWSSIPEDIALKIVSYLQVGDVRNLGSCSRFWRELCGSDFLWESLARDRWPLLVSVSGKSISSSSSSSSSSCPPPSPSPVPVGVVVEIERTGLGEDKLGASASFKEWKRFYVKWHNEMALRAASVVQYVEACSSGVSLEIRDYLKAIEDLNSLQFGFTDIRMLLFKPEVSVLLNLVGLHYCINWLPVPAEHILEALEHHKISQRQVCVKWWKVGRWFYGFRMRDESHSRQISLCDLIADPRKEHEVLGVLNRGAIHEVLRVQISVVAPTPTSWSHPSSS